MSHTQTAPGKPGAVSRALASDRLGIPAVLFFVLGGVAPLTVAAGVIPTAFATTGLTSIPAAFLVIAIILAVFAAGYVAMARSLRHAGAFYAFIAAGLGRVTGVAAALVALLAYSYLQVGLYGAFGPNAAAEAAAHLGLHAPWWAFALGAWAVVAVLGLLRVDITGRVLGVLLCAELAVIVAQTVGGLAHPASGQLSFATLSPSALGSAGFGTFGVLAVVAVLGFVGFEQAPVLGEEARRPHTTQRPPRGGEKPPPPQTHHPRRHLRRAGHDRHRLRRRVVGDGRPRRHRPRRGRRHRARTGAAVRPFRQHRPVTGRAAGG